MVEISAWPRTGCGDEPRRLADRTHPNSRRSRIACACLLAGASCLATASRNPPTLLVWNASPSTPRGLYAVLGFGEIHDGDIVIARLPRKAAVLAAARHYLPLGVPLVKRVAAVPGDQVCAKDGMVRIDGDEAAFRKRRDSNGRPLPGWTGCVDLERHQYLLLSSDAWSFDGRYFGLTEASEIIGRGKLLWRP